MGAIGEFFASGKKGKMWWRYILVRVNGFINRISRNKIGWKFSVLDLKLVQQVQRYFEISTGSNNNRGNGYTCTKESMVGGGGPCVNDGPLAADAGNTAINDRSSLIIFYFLLEKSKRCNVRKTIPARQDKFIRKLYPPKSLKVLIMEFFGKFFNKSFAS